MSLYLIAAQRWCPWCGDHMGWGGWGMLLGWLLFLLIVAPVVWAVMGGAWRRGGGRRPTADPAEDVLREQYARGEIDEETYRRRLQELRSG